RFPLGGRRLHARVLQSQQCKGALARDPVAAAARPQLLPLGARLGARGRASGSQGSIGMSTDASVVRGSSSTSVVVFGGTGGFGFAIAKFYAESGCKVVITGRDASRTAAIAAEIGGDVRGIGLDIAEPERIEAALADIEHVDRL